MQVIRKSIAIALALGLTGCADRIPTQPGVTRLGAATPAMESQTHMVVFAAEQLPDDLAARVAALGGSVEAVHAAIGVATVGGLSETAAAELAAQPGVQAVEPNVVVTLPGFAGDVDPSDAFASGDLTTTALPSPTSAQFYSRQWNMLAIHAPEAWAAGHLGSKDVVVGLIDTGLDYLHPDFVGLVDFERSKSFVPEDDPIIAARFPGRLPISDLAYHGTAVASIIGSNAGLLAGVNQNVTYVVVKAFNQNLSGTLERMLAGIIYAADQGVDVINLSAAISFNKDERPGTIAAVQRAVNYAFRKGALLVTASGNDAADLQHNGNRVRVPCEAALAICVSATGPTGAAGLNGPWQNMDAPAPYSAFGRSTIAVAAPGGAGLNNSGRKVWVTCSRTTTGTAAPACLAGQPMGQPAATSFAAPHVTGLAALLIAQLGKGNPAQIRARILQSADDLGAPGYDAFYGHGRINVARALRLIE
jgi:subtilisin family serine protease